VVSALDGVLSAERDAGVQGADAIRFTATVSYAPCPTCASFESLQALGCCVACGGDLTPCEAFGEVGQKMKCPEGVHKADGTDVCPALAQMLDLHRAMVDPSSVGYEPLTPDFAEQYAKRFVFSLDWFSRSDFIMPQFLDKYMQLEFNKGKSAAEMVPVFFGAFHDHTANTAPLFESSLQTLMGIAQDQSNPLYGFNIYEYQVAYNKACNETQLDKYASGTLARNPCPQRGFGLFELGDFKVGRTGRFPSGTQQDSQRYDVFCLRPANAEKVDALASVLGGVAPDTSLCMAGPASHPTSHCIADRGVYRDGSRWDLASGLRHACQRLEGADNCTAGMPRACEADPFATADWVFSRYVEQFGGADSEEDAETLCEQLGVAVWTPLLPSPECIAAAAPQRPTGHGSSPSGV
jgi:hypothetical protein